MTEKKLEATVFFATHLPDALRQALDYAGEDGFVASLPQLLHARVTAPFDNELWDTWFFTANSEESTITTPRGHNVAVVVHGGGIFSSPERFRRLYHADVARTSDDGFTGLFGARIIEREALELLEGTLPDGSEIPVFPFTEFTRGVQDLPRRYAVVMDHELAQTSKCGFATYEELKEDPLMIVRAGGVEAAAAYLDSAKEYYATDLMGSWHRFGDVDPLQHQAWIPFVYDCLGGATDKHDLDLSMRTSGTTDIWFTHYRVPRDAGFGLRGDAAMVNTARYVAVAPRDASISVRNLAFTP